MSQGALIDSLFVFEVEPELIDCTRIPYYHLSYV